MRKQGNLILTLKKQERLALEKCPIKIWTLNRGFIPSAATSSTVILHKKRYMSPSLS
jgi:hypothetical protein